MKKPRIVRGASVARRAGFVMPAVLVLCIAAAGEPAGAPAGASEGAAQATRLPRVLLIGDSISMSYTHHVRAQLRGIAEVYHHRGNAEGSDNLLAHLEDYLKGGPWDVIHFNCGIWDARIVNGNPAAGPARYQDNLSRIVTRLNRTGAELIWATTTPVPNDPERFRDIRIYNSAARTIMTANNIAINDLHMLVGVELARYRKPNDAHLTEEGARVVGLAVATHVREALRRRTAFQKQ